MATGRTRWQSSPRTSEAPNRRRPRKKGYYSFNERIREASMLHRIVLPGVLAALALCGSAAAQDVITMKLATVVVNDPIHQWMDEYKKRIDARSNGRIKAEVFP